LKHASPRGLYVAPVPEEPLLWTGVLFVRKGITIISRVPHTSDSFC
jgi:hypothetical protein